MEYINISHKRDYQYKIHAVSSEQHESFSVFNIQRDTGHWCSRKSDDNMSEYIILDFKEPVTIDYIELTVSPTGAKTFPRDLRFEASLDESSWRILHTEKNLELDTPAYRIDIPLTIVRFLKILIITSQKIDGKYFSEIGFARTGISGIREVTASGSSSAQNGPENLLDDSPDSYWESEMKKSAAKESLFIDLGKIFHINRIILGSGEKAFPENFYIETSADNAIWLPLLEETGFTAQVNKKYFWNTDISPVHYIRIDSRGLKQADGKFGVRMSHLEISAAPFNPFHTHNIGQLTPYSSIFQAGIVRLAKDGEDAHGTAVQGNDRRLRDATSLFKGIVQFAADGSADEGLSVQASDSRLKPATDLKPGIVRLAHDRETKQGAVVQGNDSRLQEAGLKNFGIVKICPDGMYKENAAVMGNDPRLHKATETANGIIMLSTDGASAPGTVVQANDRRLRDASTSYRGIVELAEDGEDAPDLAVQGNDRRLKNATTKTRGIVELAEDGEDSPGVAVQGNDRRLKNATAKSTGIVKLAENGEDCPGAVVQGNDRRLKDATDDSRGIVRLAHNGEDAVGAAVQGNDRRLKDSTTTAKGIAELAEDGEDAPGVAVQGNDRRLKNATTMAKGIVELAEDGEDAPGVAVQGYDRRLKDASEDAKGIVRLARDGENKKGAAVQGNDRRLKDAAATAKGIVRLAEDGENSSGAAVQGSDRRLKDATTTAKGIVELSEDGETAPGVAVQGSDRRLKDATTIAKGVVELAEDGEDAVGVVVQGNDRRLKPAGEKNPGIIQLAAHNESRPGKAVQSDDARLGDQRAPLPHVHDYAPLNHDFSSHTGAIYLRGKRQEIFPDAVPPSADSAMIHAGNDSAGPGSIGITGCAGTASTESNYSYGVVGHSSHAGVRGQSSGHDGEANRGCGIMGLSRFGAGGVFASEHDFSLYVDGYGKIQRFDDSLNLMGNGEALHVNGKSIFSGTVHLLGAIPESGDQFPANIAELFEVDEAEYISPGDILVASEGGKKVLSRSRLEYNRGVIGVISGNPTVIFNNSGTEQKVYPVALSGSVLCKIDARKNPVRPGDLLVTSGTPGCGMAGKIDSFEKVGTVFGKALDSLDDGIGIIPVFITHQ